MCKRPRDLDHLLLAERQITHLCRHIDAKSYPREKRSCILADTAPVNRTKLIDAIFLEENVFGNGELGDQRDLLEDDLNTVAQSVAWRQNISLNAVNAD